MDEEIRKRVDPAVITGKAGALRLTRGPGDEQRALRAATSGLVVPDAFGHGDPRLAVVDRRRAEVAQLAAALGHQHPLGLRGSRAAVSGSTWAMKSGARWRAMWSLFAPRRV